jgi:hypothetical protein
LTLQIASGRMSFVINKFSENVQCNLRKIFASKCHRLISIGRWVAELKKGAAREIELETFPMLDES